MLTRDQYESTMHLPLASVTFHGLSCSIGLIKFDEFLEGQLIVVSLQTLNNWKFPISSLPSANEGNVFTSVCQEFCPQRGVCQTTPRADTPWQADVPPPPDGYCSGRYASYLNAFLLQLCFFTIKTLSDISNLADTK